MRFLLGLLLGYSIRGKKPLLIATLTAIAVVCFIVLPAIALSLLALDVRRERLSRPPQTSVPALIGLDFKTAEIKVTDANLNIRILAHRRDLQLEPGTIIAQTPQGGERVDCGTVIGVTVSGEDIGKKQFLSLVLIGFNICLGPKEEPLYARKWHNGFYPVTLPLVFVRKVR